ncbi:MAG: hypothetical protein OXU45_03535, partial [Candidatus Melainabacteria bacterium]|nr:hypothetical protein [Candidatus Melainabacteria bacterium]
FVAILENEISNLASIEIDNQYKQGLSLDNLFSTNKTDLPNPELERILDTYKSQIIEAAEFCFAYYLLEDEVQSHMLQEGLDKEDASIELLLNLYDVQRDVAKYCLLKQVGGIDEFKAWAETVLADENLSASERAKQISTKFDDKISNTEAKVFSKKYIRYPESTAR